MRMISLLWRCWVVVCGIGASAALAAPAPHPTRKDRLVDERDGFRVEYSLGQEAYAEAMFAALKEFAVKEAQLAAAPAVARPGSAADLLAHRDEILRQVAAEIGLAAPTEHQGRIFDAMLDAYEFISRLGELNKLVEGYRSRPNRIELWNWAELARRLGSGEKLDGFSYNAVENTISHTFRFLDEETLVVGDLQIDGMTLGQSGQNYTFNYRGKADGIVYLTAGWYLKADNQWEITATGFTPKASRPAPLMPAVRNGYWARALVEGRQRVAGAFQFPRPAYLHASNSEKTPGEVANDFVEPAWSEFSEILARPGYVDAIAVHVILHEVVDAGIVENYIVSPDRRWLCEGVAEYVAWKVLRDRYGLAFAQLGDFFDAKLAEYTALQSKIDLRRWHAPEQMSNDERNDPLNMAHYVFAMRAVHEMARQDGTAVVPKLFQEIAKTPREKTSMKTVEKAYRKITGKKLKDVIRAAETTPVPASPK